MANTDSQSISLKITNFIKIHLHRKKLKLVGHSIQQQSPKRNTYRPQTSCIQGGRISQFQKHLKTERENRKKRKKRKRQEQATLACSTFETWCRHHGR